MLMVFSNQPTNKDVILASLVIVAIGVTTNVTQPEVRSVLSQCHGHRNWLGFYQNFQIQTEEKLITY